MTVTNYLFWLSLVITYLPIIHIWMSYCHFVCLQDDGIVWHKEDEALKRPISITAAKQLAEGCEYCIHLYNQKTYILSALSACSSVFTCWWELSCINQNVKLLFLFFL
jgi:hypothetical protein